VKITQIQSQRLSPKRGIKITQAIASPKTALFWEAAYLVFACAASAQLRNS
jgi:hypothetical protein